MAPVAPDSSGTQEHGFVLFQCNLEGLLRPRVPVDLLVGGVSEIGRFFLMESVQFILLLTLTETASYVLPAP